MTCLPQAEGACEKERRAGVAMGDERQKERVREEGRAGVAADDGLQRVREREE